MCPAAIIFHASPVPSTGEIRHENRHAQQAGNGCIPPSGPQAEQACSDAHIWMQGGSLLLLDENN